MFLSCVGGKIGLVFGGGCFVVVVVVVLVFGWFGCECFVFFEGVDDVVDWVVGV